MKFKEQITNDILTEIDTLESVRERLQKICDVLSEQFPFATVKVHHDEDYIIYYFLDWSAVKRIQFISGTGTFCISKNKRFDACLYFGFLELVEFLNFEFEKVKFDLNSELETLFKSCAVSFNYSNDVANDKITLFSNLITLKHKDNSFIKGLFRKNKYFKILLTVVKTDCEHINYCIGSFDCCKDEVVVSSSTKGDLFRLLDYALKIKYGFEINSPFKFKK